NLPSIHDEDAIAVFVDGPGALGIVSTPFRTEALRVPVTAALQLLEGCHRPTVCARERRAALPYRYAVAVRGAVAAARLGRKVFGLPDEDLAAPRAGHLATRRTLRAPAGDG